MKTSSGFVAIVGRPNVGKSTLLNRLIGEKLAGVSSKPQTTRGVVRGILTKPQGQIVFLDTPGHHDPHDALGKWMLKQIDKSLDSVDLLYWMVLPYLPKEPDRRVLKLIHSKRTPVFLLINQIDCFPKPRILPVLDAYQRLFPFREIIPISAKFGDQVPLLIQKTLECLPEGEMLFPEDQISDQQERTFVEEMIREKIFQFTSQEIPYATSVLIESFKERSEKLVAIEATIIVERPSQRAIMIGKKGAMLKRIGKNARLEIQKFIGKKVFLELWVKPVSDWKRNEGLLNRLGYR